MVKKRNKLAWSLLSLGVITTYIIFVLHDGMTDETRIFKNSLDTQSVLERTEICSKYMTSLRKIIFPKDNST